MGWPLGRFLAEVSARRPWDGGARCPRTTRSQEGRGGGREDAGPVSYLCLALMCICRPLRLEALCPHSSQTNSFSPRCLKASCRRSSVRDRKHLAQVEHCKAAGARGQAARAPTAGAPATRPLRPPAPHRVGLRRAVQLYHVALQVLLLHELLGAGGALGHRRGGQAPARQRFRGGGAAL